MRLLCGVQAVVGITASRSGAILMTHCSSELISMLSSELISMLAPISAWFFRSSEGVHATHYGPGAVSAPGMEVA